MASESSFLSQTLQSITTTKMREQSKRRNLFEAKKTRILEAVEKDTDPQARLDILLSGITDLSSSNKGISFVDIDRQSVSKNLARYLEQSKRDSSVSLKLITTFEQNLRHKLEQDSRRFEFADLYYGLLGEWTSAKSTPLEMPKEVPGELDSSFENVPKYDLDKLRERFAGVVFTPLDTDETEIDNYLSSLFGDDHAQKLLERIRESNTSFGASLKCQLTPFNDTIIKQCIAALLNNNLLNDDAKQTLSDISTNDIVLEEIADVLNLRYADLDNWSWQAEEGMYYEPRRQINGKYRIMMDMDILQAIFLHYIAIRWCQQLKPIFSDLPRDDKFWGAEMGMTDEQKHRHFFFLGATPSSSGRVNATKKSTYLEHYFLSSLPTSLSNGGDPYGEDNDDKDGSENDMKTGLGLRQAFLRQLAIDVLLHQSLEGEVAVVQSDLKWYATGLPHSTLYAVLRFWGIPEEWLKFFKKYAEAPLRMTETPGENVRTRRRGIPITDAFETLFGEAVLFCMDVAVNRLSKMSLIRFHDDIFLYGLPAQTAAAWQSVEEFVKVFGLDINTSKTGSVYLNDGEKDEELEAKFPPGDICMGMLQLTKDGRWAIDQKQVAAHTRQLQKQLGECRSIISWVQTWNSCMGRFFCDTFGEPANCFGQPHIEAILDTHANMQQQIFEGYGGSVANYLREQIKLRFSVEDVPDSFFFLPETLGGLGVKNPFVSFFLLKDQVIKDPNDRLKRFYAEEKLAYKEASDAFSVMSKHAKKLRLQSKPFGSSDQQELLSEPFFSFEEFTSQRRMYSSYLARAFKDLMLKPAVEGIDISNEVAPWFEELRHTHEVGWDNLSNENRWIMHLYAEELKETFGALSIVDRNLLPSGVMKMLKKKKVPWQLIIWD